MKKIISLVVLLFFAACSTIQDEVETAVPISMLTLTATRMVTPTSTRLPIATMKPTATLPPIDGTWIEVSSENWKMLLDEYIYAIYLIPEGGFYAYLPDDNFGIYQDGELTVYSFEESGLTQGPYYFTATSDGTALVLGYEELAAFQDGAWEVFQTPHFPDQFTNYWLRIDAIGNYWIEFAYEDKTSELRRFEGTSWKTTIEVVTGNYFWVSENELWNDTYDTNQIARYLNGKWDVYSPEYLWETLAGTENLFRGVRMTVSDAGNVYVIADFQNSLAKIDSTGNITEIPLSDSVYFYPFVSGVFTLSDDVLWVYCSTKEEFGGKRILAYYVADSDGNGGEWYLIDQDIILVREIFELPNGDVLINTYGEVYLYTPDN